MTPILCSVAIRIAIRIAENKCHARRMTVWLSVRVVESGDACEMDDYRWEAYRIECWREKVVYDTCGVCNGTNTTCTGAIHAEQSVPIQQPSEKKPKKDGDRHQQGGGGSVQSR